MTPKYPVTLHAWMAENAQPGVLYHIGAGSSFVFIGDHDTYKREMQTVSTIHRERLKISYKRQLGVLRVDPMDRGNLSIYSDKTDIDRNIDFIIKRLIFDAAKTRDALKDIKTRYDDFVNFQDRRVREIYDRELGGVAILVDGDEWGDYWFQDEYEKGMAPFRHLRGAATARPAQIEKILFESEKK